MKRVLFVGSSKDIDGLVSELAKFNPHYRVVGYVAVDEEPIHTNVVRVLGENLDDFISQNYISKTIL